MAYPTDAERARQRREEERVRAREEAKRQAELERREEEQRERDKEEERRQDALRQAQEFEAADEAERQKREAFRLRLREQLRVERKSAAREQVRRDARLDALRAANGQERRDEEKEAARDAERREELKQQTAMARRGEEKQERQQSEDRERRQEELRDLRREEQAADERDRVRAEERRDARREAERDAGRDAERAGERQAAAQQLKREEQKQTEAKDAQRQSERDERAAERRDAEREADRAEDRREAALQTKREEQQQADAIEARREAVRDDRFAERRDADRAAERTSERAAERAAERGAERAAERASERAGERTAAREEPKPKAKPAAPTRDALQARIPSGVLSGALPWLVVSRNRIVNLDGQPVLLRGISLVGMDDAPPDLERGFAAGAGITESTIDEILGWGANVIRVAVNRQRVLNGSGTWSAAHYLQDLDWIIRRAAEGGAYTILSLRRLDESTVFGTFPASGGERTPNFIAPQPDYDTVGMWQLLGARYNEEPAVLFDLYTSPHPALADDLTGFDTSWDLWTLWVRLIVAELRRLDPRALCLVSGLNWGTDLSGFPIAGTEGGPVPNLVYAAHLDPRRESPVIAMRALARSHPLFVTEWGAPTEISWCERTAAVLRDAGVGWTAAHWNGEPFIARATAKETSPTKFGLVVRRALALSADRIGRIA